MTNRVNLTPYKSRLRDYLSAKGFTVTTTDAARIRCILHNDDHPSMILYERSAGARRDGLHCPVCMDSKKYLDIFEAARIIAGIPEGADHFPDVLHEVQATLGEIVDDRPQAARSTAARPAPAPAAVVDTEPEPPRHVSLPPEEASAIYKKSSILNIASKSLHATVTEIEGTWKNLDPDGRLAFVECRFAAKFFEDGKKKYLTIWYDGQHLRSANPPIALYNRDKIATDAAEHAGTSGDLYTDICFHEGPKSIFGLVTKAGEVLIPGGESIPGFIHTGWNSGGKKLGLCDLELLRGRNVYIYPDDDEPGHATARRLAEVLRGLGCTVRIVRPLAEAPDAGAGADIVEALQVRTPEEMAEYIRIGPELESIPTADSPETDRGATSPETLPLQPIPPIPPRGATPVRQPGAFPFRILGTADDGLTYFVDAEDHLQRFRLTSLSKGQLMVLAPLQWWHTEFGYKGKVDWDNASDFIIRAANAVDFDPEVIRGIGAWREPDGRLCYNSGRTVYGDPDPVRLYLRRAEHDIGLEEEPADATTRLEMFESASAMSFAENVDCVRALAFSALAPFGGALPWRPAGFITGESQSGKSTVFNHIIRTLGDVEICSGMDSTAAGIRQHSRWSSRGIGIEEAGDDTEKALRNRTEIFSLMRQSTGADAPKAWKGTVDGQGQSFDLEKMFIFAAINPIVNATADANRLFYINMVKGTGNWRAIKARVVSAFAEAKCRRVRSFVWQHLAEIIAEAERITEKVEGIGRKSSRDAFLDAILFAAHFLVFMDRRPGDDELAGFLASAYEQHAPDDRPTDAVSAVERILDEAVPVLGDRGRMYTLRRILYGVKTRKGPLLGTEDTPPLDGLRSLPNEEVQAYAITAIQYGLGIDPDGNLAIVNDHHQIARISGLGRGYTKLLARHPNLAERSKNISFARFGDRQRRCITISSVLDSDAIPF